MCIRDRYKSTVRTLTKKTLANCEKYKQEPNSNNKDLVLVSVNEAFSLIDKAVKRMFYIRITVLTKNQESIKKLKIFLRVSK